MIETVITLVIGFIFGWVGKSVKNKSIDNNSVNGKGGGSSSNNNDDRNAHLQQK